ncbi:hypothetical protein B4U84_21595 [Westiellopsis prolifica IICB1]|nr:hypothetical protein B4U84_21595 [Westiellopsis prolifica IICB1]
MKQPCFSRGVRGDQNATRQLYKTCVYTVAQFWEKGLGDEGQFCIRATSLMIDTLRVQATPVAKRHATR